MGKGLKIGLIVIFVLVIYVLAVIVIPVHKNVFSIDLSFDKTEYLDGEVANINARLKYNSLGFYEATFLAMPVIIAIYEEGEEVPGVFSAAIVDFLTPFKRYENTIKYTIDKDKVYIVSAISNITIRGKRHIIQKNYKIENGKVTLKSNV